MVILGLEIIYCTQSRSVIHEHYLYNVQAQHLGETSFCVSTTRLTFMMPGPSFLVASHADLIVCLAARVTCTPLAEVPVTVQEKDQRLGLGVGSRNADRDGCDKHWIVTTPHGHPTLQPGLRIRDIKAQD